MFYEFRIVSPGNVFKLVSCIAITVPQTPKARRLILIGILISLTGREGGGGAMIYFVMEAC